MIDSAAVHRAFALNGLELLGITGTVAAPEAVAGYTEWIAAGMHGTMGFLAAQAHQKFAPHTIIPGTRTIWFTALRYYQPVSIPPLHGSVARFAIGREYHKELGGRLRRTARALMELFPGQLFRPFADATPLAERHYAAQAGLGFVGRNGLLIHPVHGSWFVLGELLTSVPLESCGHLGVRPGAHAADSSAAVRLAGPAVTPAPAAVSCAQASSTAKPTRRACPPRCRRCLSDCPTGALYAPYKLDARRCIAYLTVEYDGIIADDLCAAIGARIYGCDTCQDVCPLNAHVATTDVQAFLRSIAGAALDPAEILSIEDEARFTDRFAGSPLMRAGRDRLVRNACIVAGNLIADGRDNGRFDSLLERLVTDRSPVVAHHAARARAQRLQSGSR